jgi:hypothetical protein
MATSPTFFNFNRAGEQRPLLPVVLMREDRVNNGIECLSYGSFYLFPFMGSIMGAVIGYAMGALMPPLLTGLLISGGNHLEWVIFMALLGFVLGVTAHYRFCLQEDELNVGVEEEPLLGAPGQQIAP